MDQNIFIQKVIWNFTLLVVVIRH